MSKDQIKNEIKYQLEKYMNGTQIANATSATNLIGMKGDWIYIPLDEEFTFNRALIYSFSALFLFCSLIWMWKQKYEAERRAEKQKNADFFDIEAPNDQKKENTKVIKAEDFIK